MGGTSLRKRTHGISDGRVGIPCFGVGRSDLACPGAGNHTTFPVVWVRIATNLKWKTAGLESSLDFGVLGAPPRVPGGLGGPRTHRMKLRTVALHGPGARRARRARRRRAAWGGKDCHRRRPEWNPWFSGSSTRILSVLGPDPRHDTPGPGTRKKNRHFRQPGRNPWFSGSRHRIWSALGPETRQNVSKGSVRIFERIFTMIPILRLAGSGSCLPGHSKSDFPTRKKTRIPTRQASMSG